MALPAPRNERESCETPAHIGGLSHGRIRRKASNVLNSIFWRRGHPRRAKKNPQRTIGNGSWPRESFSSFSALQLWPRRLLRASRRHYSSDGFFSSPESQGLIATFSARTAPGFWWSELSSFVVLIAGLVLLWNPLHGLITLTYVLIAYFIVDGILTIILALEHRKDLSDRWQWLVVNGIIDLILAGIVISGLPGAFAWALAFLSALIWCSAARR